MLNPADIILSADLGDPLFPSQRHLIIVWEYLMFKEKTLARTVRVMFAGAIGVGLFGHALAQETAQEAKPIARVEVTGSSIKRADVEGALPVQMVSREDIKRSGATNTAELLTTLSSNSMVGA